MINIGAWEVLQAKARCFFHESDSAVLVELIQNDDPNSHPLGSWLLFHCRGYKTSNPKKLKPSFMHFPSPSSSIANFNLKIY